ncbi:uncharacterized protein LOC107370990 [Tetranychus urticae]|uniref:uncharacterized protein LOC107370990 n=1 Tax=Tetranychus urticae TaxID=32264 RepID=UPI00077BF0DD|nr:uncharacterized protein LOC107370990 [Tetranychus urticae]
MDPLKNDDKLIIVNRSKEHRISKNLIRKVPYFEKMLSHYSSKSKENKVVLDFDEKVLELILNRVEHGYIFMEMDCVIKLCTIADYFGMDKYLINECFTHFHNNFAIEHLPVIIPQVTATSKCINSGALNAFICRYFTKIAKTNLWLNYPIETIEYICKLDLMVYSEMQVFDVIMKWINFKADARKCYLKELLKSIRWCYLEDKDLAEIKENKCIQSSNFEPKSCFRDKSGCNCVDRTRQSYFIVIEKFNDTDLRIKLLDDNFLPLVNQVIQLDESLSLHLLHDEHVSDVFFDSGRKLIRIDWKQKKYRLLEAATFQSHFTKCLMLISDEQKRKTYFSKIEPHKQDHAFESALLEADDMFILVRINGNKFQFHQLPNVLDIRSLFGLQGHSYLATILDNNIYMLTKDLELIQFNIGSGCVRETIGFERFRDKFHFSSLLLTSSRANDDEVFIIDKSTKDLFCYNVKTEKWSSMGRISNCDSGSDGKMKSADLIAFTSTFLSKDAIKACLNMNSNE